MNKSLFDEPVADDPDKTQRTAARLRLVLTSMLVIIAMAATGFGGFYYAKYQTTISSLNEMKADLESIERKVSDISTSAECDLDEVESRLDEVDEAIKKVGSDLSDVAFDVSSIESDVASIESDVSSIQLRVGY